MPTEEEIAAFEREFGIRPSVGPDGVHADMERTIVRNELEDLRHRLDRARAGTMPFDGVRHGLQEAIDRKEAAARACGRL